MLDPLAELAKLYERQPVVCHSPVQVRDKLRANRGRHSDRHKDCDITIRQMAIRAGLPVGTASRAEAAPEMSSLATLQRLARARGQGIAIVFYDLGSDEGGKYAE